MTDVMSKTRTSFKRAVVATISLAAPLAPLACGSTVTTSNPPGPECPAETPASGSACAGGLSCFYPSPDGCDDREATCVDGVWQVGWGGSTCNPPPPPWCPELLPAHGESCYGPIDCTYQDECGQNVTASCGGESATWTVNDVVSCNPPPPCPAELPENNSLCDFETSCAVAVDSACGVLMATATCAVAEDGSLRWEVAAPLCEAPADCDAFAGNPSQCELHTSCRWLVSGCDPSGVFFPSACYPADDCVSCEPGEACTPVTFDPCWDSFCDACGAPAAICLPT
jgi:hypothetical protein